MYGSSQISFPRGRMSARRRLALVGQALGQKDFQQGLVRYVTAIRENLQVLNHGDGKTYRYRSEGWLQINQLLPFPRLPIQVFRRVRVGPKVSFLVLGFEIR